MQQRKVIFERMSGGRVERLRTRLGAVLGMVLLLWWGTDWAAAQAPLALPKGSVLDSGSFAGSAAGQSQGQGSAGAKKPRGTKAGGKPADKDAVQPAFAIPVAPLGFAAPAPFYFGERFAMVSLNFLDEDTLLFAFRVPGLIAREPAATNQPTIAERHIRALVLALPSGEVKAESLWVLHDYSRFLWTMKGRKFLLRDGNLLQVGDGALHLEPFLRFPGTINAIQFDAGQRLLIADTTEAPAPEAKEKAAGREDSPGAVAGPAASALEGGGQRMVGSPATAAASRKVSADSSADGQGASAPLQRLLRVLNMDTRQVMLFTRTNSVNGPLHLPVDGEGYYDALRGSEFKWLVAFEYFKGSSTPIGLVESTCEPNLEAMAPEIVVVSACLASGARHLTAFARNRDKDRARLWDVSLPPTKVWPQWASSGDGMRFARATLEVAHPVGIYSPLDDSDVRGQSVQVYDTGTGALQLTVPVSPVLDGGGNFALSPSGRRLAVLNDGAIQVFALPEVAAMPAIDGKSDAQKRAAKP